MAILVPTTAVNHALAVSTFDSLLPATRPVFDPYNYPPPRGSTSLNQTPTVASVLQECAFMLSSLAVPQYSVLDLINNTFFVVVTIWVLLRFPLHLHIGWIKKLVIYLHNRECIESCIDYAIREFGHIDVLFELSVWLCGYCTLLALPGCSLICILSMISFFRWLSFKQGIFRSSRLVVQFAGAARRVTIRYPATGRSWLVRQTTQWYEDRMNKKRIDRIFGRPLSTISIGECLLPDMFIAIPNHPTMSQILKAMATDLIFFSWNFLIVLIKLRVRSLVRIWPHTKEAFSITAQIVFGLDEDGLSWVALMACFRFFLRCIRTVFDTIYRRIKVFPGAIGNWSQTTQLLPKFRAAGEKFAEARGQPKAAINQKDSASSRELGNKCVGYRRTLMELASDNNYLRLLLCSVLNAHHNILNGKKPNALDAEHPYQPSLIEFRPVPDEKTGLYIGYKEHTRRREHNLGKEYKINLQNFAMDTEREPHRMSAIIKRRPNLPGNVLDGFDPFLKDHWVFSGAIPGMNIPPYSEANNPFDISAKRPRPIIRPEIFFGPQIEDFAARGQLGQWGSRDNVDDMKQAKFTPFSREELCNFTTEIRFGTLPRKRQGPCISSGMAVRGYAADPCPRGEPRQGDFPLYKNFA